MSKTNSYQIFSVADALLGKVKPESKILIQGWVKTRRDSKAGFSFISINDGSCFDSLQVLASNNLKNYQDEILKVTTGCCLSIKGKLQPSPAQGQNVELQAEEIKVLGWVDDPETYPVSPKPHSLEYLREWAHLRVRTNTFGAMSRVQNCLAHAIHEFFYQKGFQWLRTPIITSNDCEGAGQLFRVTTLDLMNLPRAHHGIDFGKDFFGQETYLSVSGQLNAEAYCLALSKVYTFGPTFRAENSNTSRHLAEFWMVEPEMAFYDLLQNAELAEEMIRYLCQAVLKEVLPDLKFFTDRIDKDCIPRLEKIVQSTFTHMDYTDAIKHLEKAKKDFAFPVKWGIDLQSEHERYLAEELVKGPVILMNYPKEIKSFYMRLNDDEKTVAAMDVLVPGMGEIIGGSQREERFEVLDARMGQLKMNKEIYRWYLDLRRYGSAIHSGYGLGFERFVSYLTGLSNLRDTIPFPRTPKHAKY
jgi:asparaginyl-tRNA synthetase